MINVAGENIHPTQVEEVLNQHPQVVDSIVVGVPDPVRGESPAAYVVPAGPGLTEDELRRFLQRHAGLAEFKRPRYYRLVDELPSTATGKRKHDEVRRWARRDFARAEAVAG